ncbi:MULTISPECIES: universal stress protein [Haloferax]|uniref:HPP family protein n=1 Tax=Haloferax sp. Atlit-48N TaxID=2077198 RepID=A0ACD5HSV7_9EURY|nr:MULTISPECIES: HPP family protein [Haloferax]RDZ31631.1 universal stress protein UspA [Haloferax sp. Atlit-48N]RDZ34767.1 universal stress protein UspA [Haloferax sp. Atlit-24N]RDZ36379.1 universal stress protein UspA [Haloferax sp. Atlit-47N]RLM35178.1 HPP family protein [Haloferax sp. Atlit-109R]RLM43027.1 HPP family protein [Haloferax sp. Atlit-105R]
MDPRHLAARAVARVGALRDRIRRIERREMVAFGRWIENTNNLLHLSILLIIPVLIAVVTLISNSVSTLSFLLFPPLASGSYTLFSDPEGRYASPVKFVVALTVGALCGLVAVGFTGWAYGPTGTALVHPSAAALAIFLAGATTWALDVEAPSAFSTALLTLVTGNVNPEEYVVSIFFASVVIAIAFTVWREQFYERRAEYLYGTVRGDDHVLVPMRGETATQTAFFAARLAAAHSAGKVVLLDVLPATPADESDATPDTTADGELDADADASVERLESCAHNLRTQLGVPVEIAVARGDPLTATTEAAANTNSDLVVTPYEEDRGLLSDYIRGLFGGSYDTVAFRSTGETYRWRRVLVLVARPGDAAHAMIDFATRLAGKTGSVSVTTCISSEVERRPAESKLANLVETADGNIETRVARSEVTAFIASNAASYDLVVLGSSGDRSPASRFISPPTFERIREIDCDVAVFDRGH